MDITLNNFHDLYKSTSEFSDWVDGEERCFPLQCFDVDGWVMERTSSLYKPAVIIPIGSSLLARHAVTPEKKAR